jgi:uncharacterized protein YfaS (alpha-2-macroglobulin family)
VRSVQFSSEGPLRGYYLVNEGGFDRKPAAQSITEGLEITREFLDANGKVAGSVGLGDEVTVHIKYRAVGRSMINDAVLVDLLPGGFDVVVPNVTPSEQPFLTGSRAADEDEEESARGRAGCLCTWLVTRPPGFPDFADLREDRVVLYGRATDQVQEFSYRIKATNVGSYVVPAAFGESMYDRKLRARSVAGRIVVERH